MAHAFPKNRFRDLNRVFMARACRCAAAVLVSELVLAAGCAGTAHFPQLQEGLWEVRVQSIESPGNKKTDFTYKICRDHGFDKRADAAVKKAKNCTTRVEDLGGDRYSAASRCTDSGMVIVSKGLSIYQNGKVAHSETAATYTPAFYGKTDETMIQDQRYVGACPAGVRPGDRIMADERIVHPSK
jgi:hypothetical protein